MTQDFAKIRPEPLLEKKPVDTPPTWSLMITGVLVGITIGVFICVLLYLSGNVPPLNAPQPAVAATPVCVQDTVADGDENVTDENMTDTTEENGNNNAVAFEFYTELPRYEVSTDAVPMETVDEETTGGQELAGVFMLQTGAFQQRESAELEMRRQAALGLNVIVKPAELPGRTLYLVQNGPYATRAALNAAQLLLDRSDIPSLTIQLR